MSRAWQSPGGSLRAGKVRDGSRMIGLDSIHHSSRSARNAVAGGQHPSPLLVSGNDEISPVPEGVSDRVPEPSVDLTFPTVFCGSSSHLLHAP